MKKRNDMKGPAFYIRFMAFIHTRSVAQGNKTKTTSMNKHKQGKDVASLTACILRTGLK